METSATETVNQGPTPANPPREKKYSKEVEAILAEPKEKKTSKLDIEKRFYDYQSRVDKKIVGLQEEKKSKELEGCTFAPKINKKSEKRDFHQFMKHVENFDKVKKEKIERIKKEKLDSETPKKSSFKPTLSEKTIKLTTGHKSPDPIHERLYKESAVLKKKHEELSKQILEESCSFKPKLNEQSENLKRKGRASLRLFEISKSQAKSPEPFFERPIEKLVNPESEAIILDKFVKDVDEAFPSKADEEAPMLNFLEFVEILKKLSFITSANEGKGTEQEQKLCDKAFKALSSPENPSLPIQKAKNFILSVMNLDTNLNQQSKKQHLEYLDFYKTRQNAPKTKKPRSSTPPGFSFRPILDENSEKIAASVKQKRTVNLGNDKIENILMYEYKKTVEKLQAVRKNHEQKKLECPDCTFKPKINRGPKDFGDDFKDNFSLISDYMKMCGEKTGTRNEMLYLFSKLESEKKERFARTVEDMEIEKNMGECSFAPSLDKPKINLNVSTGVKGVAEVVERMRKARNEEEKPQGEIFSPMKFGIDFKPRIANESEKKDKKLITEKEDPEQDSKSFSLSKSDVLSSGIFEKRE